MCIGGIIVKVRVAKYSKQIDVIYSLCHQQPKDRNYLFFECDLAIQVWQGLIDWVKLPCVMRITYN